jgi:hypothetical protein
VTIKYDPAALLRKIAPAKKIEKLLKGNLTLKKTALSFAEDIDFLDADAIQRVALKTIKGYRERAKDDPEEQDVITSDPVQLVQRVQNEVVFQISGEIKDQYSGEFYVWLPSSADEPDPEHQLNYGSTFQIGHGEMPGERYGCQCGMEILVDGNKLDL